VNPRAERAPTPRQAPAAPANFTGRAEQLNTIARLFRGDPAGQVVCVVSGMAGVGKTSLALRAAESLRDDFPDGQLHVDLRGADDEPVSTLAVLSRLLRGLGTPARAVPIEADEAGALYRSLLADRRVLVLLDNARNAAQIRPLLPGGGTSGVIVTSRHACPDLIDAAHVDLPVLSREEAVAMLSGTGRTVWTADDRQAAAALAEGCGRLPVALRMVMSRLTRRAPAELLRLTAGAEARADEAALQDTFALSYRELRADTARLFRVAAHFPGTTFTLEAAAALAGWDADVTGQALDRLAEANMIEVAGTDRYRYHDLLRQYALDLQPADGAPEELDRLADWHLTRTAAAVRLFYPAMVRLPTDADPADMCFADVGAAAAWLDEEVGNLVALIETAVLGGRPERAWQLADQLRSYFFVRRDAVSWLATGQAGLTAAETAGDATAQAAMHQTVGQAHWAVGRHREALRSYERGAAAARAGGWLIGEAYLLHNLGLVHAELGMTDQAHELYEHVLRVRAGPEFTHIRAVTLNDLGVMCTEQGRLHEAVRHFRAALALNSDGGRLPSATANRSNLGMVLRRLEEFVPAHECLTRSLTYYQETANQNGQMATMDELSHLYQQRSEWSAGVGAAVQALRIAEQLANPKATAGVFNTLGGALLGARAVTEAQTRFREALELSRRNGYLYSEAQAAAGLADTLLAHGATDEARVDS
jgi:tetratricopeptide (TPR) repeat protein